MDNRVCIVNRTVVFSGFLLCLCVCDTLNHTTERILFTQTGVSQKHHHNMVKEGQLILVLLATASLISAVAIGNTKRSHENEAGHHDDKEDHHGGIKMGVSNDLCDNAKVSEGFV